MEIVERHTSPDGLLHLIVDHADDGDWTVGFESLDGFAWHTHGDMLTRDYRGSPDTAVRCFVDDIISSRRVIAISRIGGKIRDAWIPDDSACDEMVCAEANETIEERFWNGQQSRDRKQPATDSLGLSQLQCNSDN